MLLYAVYTLYNPIKYNIYKHNTQICFSVVIAFACIIASFFGGAYSFKSTILLALQKMLHVRVGYVLIYLPTIKQCYAWCL